MLPFLYLIINLILRFFCLSRNFKPLDGGSKNYASNDLLRSVGFIVVIYAVCRLAFLDNKKQFVIPIVA
ncbi:MAG: hypothetical protein CM15mP83_9150 [Flavobacteriaceae bacterium]|nr:MAG: hypothetical protein CM15mP83_9150 [Flavobacteriaceae bacterium]